jgi:hypothetical protein
MIAQNSLNTSDLGARKPSITLQPDGIKPELRQLVVMLNMHMRRFITISSGKKETVGPDSENSWHYWRFIAFFSVEKEQQRVIEILLEGLNRLTPLYGLPRWCKGV